MSITPQQATARFGQIADQFAALVRDVELKTHDGKKCPGCRTGALIIMCQALGILPGVLIPTDPELIKRCAEEAGG